MGALEYSVATLRFFGDDLVPDEISALLSGSPTASQHKGQELKLKNSAVRIAKTGSWRLTSTQREPEDLEAQIFEILNQLTQDLTVWEHLSNHYQPDLFCGIFMAGRNDGLALSAKALLALGQRGISLDLDIYDPTR
ncbi:DUF4279 domain-containing protein [Xanthomonas euvesicatoria pv. eucalypti]|uniref:DUF4279 domain-containing protein n=1 Tax=Xanthomonas euvesicatoria TaxID=456327 RepID=UPI001C451A2E|nr:DUF4279 domain-containing protein [Xanthomonas euvesicatoria]MBV6807678.1 DUF4279 domain-containing protein [Xanthomonas campestris pv. convolvuli]MDO7930610.1 DUF4279 domain-containing protein [Xanthomonas euvesicatoria pv. eucalypti]MDO7934848.1 DUF4279 domain-containing protein [Xanthomonas euvesicatoria pv. eucalypti]MDO7938991.1 DUF4279 domain-containing protein [Xanthomonas euvesicatoria pv. eucalypti]MDO7943197.1 DUF4279 domain-containing protein [Xanthomonas euvesicatoria pv. eucaly